MVVILDNVTKRAKTVRPDLIREDLSFRAENRLKFCQNFAPQKRIVSIQNVCVATTGGRSFENA